MTALSPGARCVAHPSRPAVDRCPTCERPRCGADATGATCLICVAETPTPVRRSASPLELLVRANLACLAMALVAGVVLQEYPGAPIWKYAAPAIAGVAIGMVATAAAGEPKGAVLQRIRIVAVVFAVLGTALGFTLETTYKVYDLKADVLLPYVCAGVAAWLWTAPPRRRKVRASEDA